jgi:hypothetical protein
LLTQGSGCVAFLSGLTPYLPLVLTIVGWLVLSRQQDKRERRKEIRELIRMIENRVDSILELTTDYYGLPGDDPKCRSLELKIKQSFNGVRSLHKRLNSAGFRCDVRPEFVHFRQSVMLGEFESLARKPDTANGEALSVVASAGFELVSKIDRAYFETFAVSLT